MRAESAKRSHLMVAGLGALLALALAAGFGLSCAVATRYPGETIGVTSLRLRSYIGDVEATYVLSNRLAEGLGVACIPSESALLRLRAAQGGSVRAMRDIGVDWVVDGCPKSRQDECFGWLQRAALHGDGAAQDLFGRLTLAKEPEDWTREAALTAAANGDVDAMFFIGRSGMTDSDALFRQFAACLLRIAAVSGHPRAMLVQGNVCRSNGQTAEAAFWYDRAARAGLATGSVNRIQPGEGSPDEIMRPRPTR